MTTPDGGIPYYDCDLRQDVFLVIGNEGNGIGDELIEASDILGDAAHVRWNRVPERSCIGGHIDVRTSAQHTEEYKLLIKNRGADYGQVQSGCNDLWR